jgi:hypothetical protein
MNKKENYSINENIVFFQTAVSCDIKMFSCSPKSGESSLLLLLLLLFIHLFAHSTLVKSSLLTSQAGSVPEIKLAIKLISVPLSDREALTSASLIK